MSSNKYLCTVPDSVYMDREYFSNLLKRYRHHRNISFGFSKKHTEDILAYRKQLGLSGETTIPGNLYSLPVEWNTNETYVK